MYLHYFLKKFQKIVQCRLKKVAQTLLPLTPENCHVFPSSRQPHFQRLRSPVTSIHIFLVSLVPRQPFFSFSSSIFALFSHSSFSIFNLLSFLFSSAFLA